MTESGYTATRTKAVPKNSLFGTALEKIDPTTVASVNTAEYESERAQQTMDNAHKYEYKLPAQLQNQAARRSLEVTKKNLKLHENHIGSREHEIMNMENRARYFQNIPQGFKTKNQIKKKMLLADPGLDLETTRSMNDVGLSNRNNYNRDKYQERPPVHKYVVIGDPLEYGMDFSLHQTETKEKFNMYDTPPQIRYYRSLRRDRATPSKPTTNHEKGQMPANIRARFGSRMVEQLLSDKEAVDRVKARLEQERHIRQHKHQETVLPVVEVKTPQNYSDLSHALRQDKFAGYTYLQPSLMKETYTPEVFQRRYKDPDEFRHQWDEYGKWREEELMREKMSDQYGEYINSLPKFTANWDRNIERTITRPDKPDQTVKKKRHTKQKKPLPPPKSTLEQLTANEPVFDDVIFETPPTTPQPVRSLALTPPAGNNKQRDDAFWNFYEQGLPAITKQDAV